MCGFSKYVLFAFGWRETFWGDGWKLINEEQEVVGRLECFYGFKTDIGNRFPANQPYLQRWVVNKELLKKAVTDSACPYEVKTVISSLITDSEK